MQSIFALSVALFAAATTSAVGPTLLFRNALHGRQAEVVIPLNIDLSLPENSEGVTCDISFTGDDQRHYTLHEGQKWATLSTSVHPICVDNAIIHCESSLEDGNPNQAENIDNVRLGENVDADENTHPND
ncbi:unnamed protein product [Diplocarpon coronariae]